MRNSTVTPIDVGSAATRCGKDRTYSTGTNVPVREVSDTYTPEDLLVWYNNIELIPFLEAISKQTVFYQQRGIDMFKDGISVPGLTLLYLFNDMPSNTCFTLFNEKHKYLHHVVKDQIVEGPARIFSRYHEKDVTKIREIEFDEVALDRRL